jgi:transposase InsO family protein
VYQQRVGALDHARNSGNVAATCRTFGISPKTFYKWRSTAAQYGLAALMPETKRPPATPTHIVELLLTLAITMPTLGCRQYADRLFDQGFQIGKSTVQNLLVKHGLGRRHQRPARAAAITALTTGLVTEVYQLTALMDTATRWVMVWLVHGTVNTDVSVAFFERIWKTWKRMAFPIEAIVADNGPECTATKFADALAAKNVTCVFIPARSPHHNVVVERFQGTMLQECWRPAPSRPPRTTLITNPATDLRCHLSSWTGGLGHIDSHQSSMVS